MSWLCGGRGVAKENTIEAGQRALAQHRWERGKQLLDRAWQRDPHSHQVIIDICERSVDEATYKFQSLGDGPAPLVLDVPPGTEPDRDAVEKLQKDQAAGKKAFENRRKSALSKLHHLHRIAKHYNKRLLTGQQDPVALGGLCTQIGRHHKAMSAASLEGYSAKHNEKAFEYFSRAIESYEHAHLPQTAPVAGRMDVVADRVLHTTEHWYKPKHKNKVRDATALLLEDFVRLINMPTDHEDRLQHLEALALLLQRQLPTESHTFMLNDVMAPLSQWLCDPSEDAAGMRTAVLRVFEQIIHHQEWAKHEAGDALHRFINDGELALTLEHMQVLFPCYRGLIEGKSKTQGRYDVLPDLEVIRRRMHTNEKALVQVLVLLDHVVRCGSSRQTAAAADMIRSIGMESPADNVQYSALIILDHLAAYNDRPTNAPMALGDMAALIGTMRNPQLREYAIVRIAFHNAHPARLEAADHALYTTLGLTRNDVEQLFERQAEIYKSISAIEANSSTVPL